MLGLEQGQAAVSAAMMPVMRLIWLLIVLLLTLGMLACRNLPQDTTDQYNQSQRFPLLGYMVKELAHDRNIVLKVDEKNYVDGDSTLLIRFKPPEPRLDQASPEFRRAKVLIDEVLSIAKTRQDLVSVPVELMDKAGAKAMLVRERDHEQNLRNALTAGLPQAFRQEGLGEFSVTLPPNSSYHGLLTTLVTVLKGNQERVTDRAREGKQVEVTVAAFVHPVNQLQRRLHVDGYDNLPEDKLRPSDRQGKVEDPQAQQEQETLSRLLTPVKQGSNDLANISRAVIQRTSAEVGALKSELRMVDWSLASVAERVENIPAGVTKAEKKSAKLIRQRATQLKADFDQVATSASQLEKAVEGEQDIRSFIAEIKTLRSDLAGLRLESPRLLTRLNEIKRESATLPQDAKQEVLGYLITGGETFFPYLLPRVSDEALELLETSLSRNEDYRTAVAKLGTAPPDIPRGLDNLVTGRIELDKSGWAVGDQVMVKVIITEKQDKTSALGKESEVIKEERITYKGEAILAGWYRQVGADLIVVRGFGNAMARKWKTNIAAHADWHYGVRDPAGWYSKFWNWLDPGFGLHLASLDQGPDTVELGIGGNLTLFGNLFIAGYGHNFSVDRQYVYVGLNLLDALNKAKPRLTKLAEGLR